LYDRIETFAYEVPEDEVSQALELAQKAIQPLIHHQLSARQLKPPIDVTLEAGIPSPVLDFAMDCGYTALTKLFRQGHSNKTERGQAETEARTRIIEAITSNPALANTDPSIARAAIDQVVRKAYRDSILNGVRADGRYCRPARGYSVFASMLLLSRVVQRNQRSEEYRVRAGIFA
jgi:polyribonucleotide nucleotidyltransferase